MTQARQSARSLTPYVDRLAIAAAAYNRIRDCKRLDPPKQLRKLAKDFAVPATVIVTEADKFLRTQGA